jgi:hypothetical protein
MRRVDRDARDASWALWLAGAAMMALLANGLRAPEQVDPAGPVATMSAAQANLASQVAPPSR